MNIKFPPRDPPLLAQGRNGWFNATGLTLTVLHHEILIENWTSKGFIGRGCSVLPADRDVLRKVADELNRIATTLP